jgi:hypothetical protein
LQAAVLKSTPLLRQAPLQKPKRPVYICAGKRIGTFRNRGHIASQLTTGLGAKCFESQAPAPCTRIRGAEFLQRSAFPLAPAPAVRNDPIANKKKKTKK